MFDIIDVPARIMAYRDAGHTRDEAKRLAYIDMQDASEAILKADYAQPISVEIAEMNQEPLETDVDLIDSERYDTAVELKAVVGTCREAGMGMNDVNYRLAAAIQNNLNCRHVGEKVMVTMESVHAMQISDRDLIMHFEDGVGETLKKLWEKIRNSFINTFNKIKTWLIKAFDGTQRLGNKAKAVKAQAEGKQGTVNQTSFTMNGLKQLSINGKPPEPNTFPSVVGGIAVITDNLLGNTAEYYNKLTEKLSDSVKALTANVEATMPEAPKPNADGTTPAAPIPEVGTDTAKSFELGSDKNSVLSSIQNEIKGVTDSFNKILEEWTDAASDSRFKDIADDKATPKTIFKTKTPFPGDKMFVVTVPKVEGVNSAESLAALKLAFGGTVETISPKPRELEDSATFKTMSQAQIVSVCDSVMNACKAGLDYKLLFAQRDKAFKNLGDQLDRTVNESDKLQGTALTFVKANVSAATAIFGKINRMESSWLRYSMGTLTKAIDYCQGSLSQMS